MVHGAGAVVQFGRELETRADPGDQIGAPFDCLVVDLAGHVDRKNRVLERRLSVPENVEGRAEHESRHA
jgi:hypothetical protein